MSIVIESVSSVGSSSNNNNLTITKPTGVVVGDLLVASLSGFCNGSASSFNTLSGWTLATGLGNEATTDTYLSIQYRVATAADVSASDYTFTTTGAARAARGVIFRLSNVSTSQTLGAASSKSSADTGTAFSASPSSYTPIADGAFVVIQVGGLPPSATAVTTSGYTIPGVTPTEAYDASVTFSGTYGVLAAAYGLQTTAQAINSYTATFSSTINDHNGQIAIFQPPKNVSVGNTFFTTTSTTFSQGAQADSFPAATFFTTTSQTFTQGGKGTAPTQWTNEPATTTTWTNET